MAQKPSNQPIDLNPIVSNYISQVIDEKYPGLSKDQKQLIKDSVIQKISTQVNLQKYREFLERLRLANSETERSQIIYEFIKNFIQSDFQGSVESDSFPAPQGIISKISRRFKTYVGETLVQATSLDLPEETSILSEALETKFRTFLQKNSARSITDPNFTIQAEVSLEQVREYQSQLLSHIRSSPRFSTFNSTNGEVDDFFTSLLHARIDSQVRNGVFLPHNSAERHRLIQAITHNDKNTFRTYMSVGLNLPDIDALFHDISRFEPELSVLANGELRISNDPVLEYKKLIREEFERDLGRSSVDAFIKSQEKTLNSMLLEAEISRIHMSNSSAAELGAETPENAIQGLQGLVERSNLTAFGRGESVVSENSTGVDLSRTLLKDTSEKPPITVSKNQLERVINPSFEKILSNPNLTTDQKSKINEIKSQLLSVGDLTFADQNQVNTFLSSLSVLDSTTFKQLGIPDKEVQTFARSFSSIQSLDSTISSQLKQGLQENVYQEISRSKVTVTKAQVERVLNPSFEKILSNPNLTPDQKSKINEIKSQLLSVGDLTFKDQNQVNTFLGSLSVLDSETLGELGIAYEKRLTFIRAFSLIESLESGTSKALKDSIYDELRKNQSENPPEFGYRITAEESSALVTESIDVLLTKANLTKEQRESLNKIKAEISINGDIFFDSETEFQNYIRSIKNFDLKVLTRLSALSPEVNSVIETISKVSELKIDSVIYRVNSTEMSNALEFALSHTKNLTPEQRDQLIELRTKIIGINGRLNIVFNSEEEKAKFLQSIRELDSHEILKFIKSYSSEFELHELIVNLELAKQIVQVNRLAQARNLNPLTIGKTNDYLDLISWNMLSKMHVFGSKLESKFPNLTGVYKTLKGIKEIGPVGKIDQRFINVFTNDYFAVNITDIFDMLDASKNITGYKSIGDSAVSFLSDRLSFVNSRIESVLGFLDKVDKPNKLLKGLKFFGIKFGKEDKSSLLSGYSFNKKVLNKALLRDFKKIVEAMKRKGSIEDLVSYLERNAATPEQFALLSKKYFRNTFRSFETIKFNLLNYAKSNARFSGLVRKGLEIGEKYAPGLKKFGIGIYEKAFKFINPAKLVKFYAKDFNRFKGIAVKFANNFNKLPAPARRAVGFALKKLLLKSSVRIATLGAKLTVGAFTGVGLLLLIPDLIDLAKFFMSDDFKKIAKKVIIGFFAFIAIFVLIIYSAFMIALGVTNSDSERDFRTEPTYGSTDAVSFEYSESYGTSVGSTLSTRNSRGDTWGPYGSSNTWDNLKKSDFRNPNMNITQTNCRIVCNMMKAAAGLTPGENSMLSRNPYFFNGRIADYTDPTVADKINNNSAGQEYYCNTMVYTVLRDIDTGLNDPPGDAKMFWATTNSPFFRHFHGRTFNSPAGSISGEPQTYKLTMLRAHGDSPSSSNTSTPLCVAINDMKAGDVVFFDRPHCVLSNTFNDADGDVSHVGMFLYVDTAEGFLYTFEANNVRKKGAYRVKPCTTTSGQEGFELVDSGNLKLCRAFSYTNIDPSCPASGTSFTCDNVPLGTPGFQEGSTGGGGGGVGVDY